MDSSTFLDNIWGYFRNLSPLYCLPIIYNSVALAMVNTMHVFIPLICPLFPVFCFSLLSKTLENYLISCKQTRFHHELLGNSCCYFQVLWLFQNDCKESIQGYPGLLASHNRLKHDSWIYLHDLELKSTLL